MAVALLLLGSVSLALCAWWSWEPTYHPVVDWLGRCITIWLLVLSAALLVMALVRFTD